MTRMVKETITPERAQELLDNHVNYRKFRPTTALKYATTLKNDGWADTGESIKLDKKGKMVDGQHRMAAIVQTGIPVEMWVTYDVEDSAVEKMDDSLPRSTADVLGARGIANPKLMAAAAGTILAWGERGAFANSVVKLAITGRGNVLAFVEDHREDMERAVKNGRQFTSGAARSLRVPPAFATAFSYVTDQIDSSDSALFINGLVTGENLVKGSPILALRTWLLNKSGSKVVVSNEELAHAFAKAWNGFRTDAEMYNIRIVNMKGKRAENRPLVPELI